jgi:hypothetical protein
MNAMSASFYWGYRYEIPSIKCFIMLGLYYGIVYN